MSSNLTHAVQVPRTTPAATLINGLLIHAPGVGLPAALATRTAGHGNRPANGHPAAMRATS